MKQMKNKNQPSGNLNAEKRFVFFLITVILIACVCEVLGWITVKSYFPKYEIVRRVLIGSKEDKLIYHQNSVGQAYLLYIPAPNFVSAGFIQHNEHGYRGPAVPLRRTHGKLRILFLGGSTTYGWTVDNPNETYPAFLGKILEKRLPDGLQGIEIINGGVMWGTTAENLTHYIFKYRYYKPDIVVIEEGGNDAQGSAMITTYQPDYSHWRRTLPEIYPLSSKVRWIMHSRFVSLFVIHTFYSHFFTGHFVRDDILPPAKWYRSEKSGQIPEKDLAFKNNLSTLIREIRADGSEIVLVPFRPNPANQYSDNILAEMTRNEKILKNLATEFAIDVAPFPAEVISTGNWTDDCHLSAAGEREKALHVSQYLIPIINRILIKVKSNLS